MWCILAAGGWCEVRRLQSTPGSTWWPGLLHPVLYKHPTVCVHLENSAADRHNSCPRVWIYVIRRERESTKIVIYDALWCSSALSKETCLLSEHLTDLPGCKQETNQTRQENNNGNIQAARTQNSRLAQNCLQSQHFPSVQRQQCSLQQTFLHRHFPDRIRQV